MEGLVLGIVDWAAQIEPVAVQTGLVEESPGRVVELPVPHLAAQAQAVALPVDLSDLQMLRIAGLVVAAVVAGLETEEFLVEVAVALGNLRCLEAVVHFVHLGEEEEEIGLAVVALGMEVRTAVDLEA